MIDALLEFISRRPVSFFPSIIVGVIVGWIATGWWLSRRRFNGFIRGVQPKLSPIDEAGMAILRSVRETPERWNILDVIAVLHASAERILICYRWPDGSHEPSLLRNMSRPLLKQICKELQNTKANRESQELYDATRAIIETLEPPQPPHHTEPPK